MRKVFLGLIVLLFVFIATLMLLKIDSVEETQLTKKQTISYVIVSNTLRKKYGVPLIEPHWILHESDSNQMYWASKDDRVNTLHPLHLYKSIFLIDGKPSVEEDHFHFEGYDSIAYRLILTHKYVGAEKLTRSINQLIIYYRGKYPPSWKKEVSTNVADSILFKWKLHPQP